MTGQRVGDVHHLPYGNGALLVGRANKAWDNFRRRKEAVDSHSMVQQELLAGERLVWAGQPDPAALASTRWPIAAPGLFLALFSLFWLTTTLALPMSEGEGVPVAILLFFPLIGLVMLGFGLALLLSPLRYWRKAKHMAYAVTDGRVLIAEPGRVLSFEPGDIQQLVRRDKGGGRGDLFFRQEQGNPILAMYTFGAAANRKVGFYGVSGVRAAEDAIRKLKRSAP